MAVPVDLRKWQRALRHPRGPRSATMRHVLLTLSTWASNDGSSMYPTMESLSVATVLHRETVRRTLEEAGEEEWVARSRRPGGNYTYAATIPEALSATGELDHPWEKDPQWTSERVRRNRPWSKPESVPAQNRDGELANRASVPAHDRDGASRGYASVPVEGGSVPVLDGNRPSPVLKPSLSRTGLPLKRPIHEVKTGEGARLPPRTDTASGANDVQTESPELEPAVLTIIRNAPPGQGHRDLARQLRNFGFAISTKQVAAVRRSGA